MYFYFQNSDDIPTPDDARTNNLQSEGDTESNVEDEDLDEPSYVQQPAEANFDMELSFSGDEDEAVSPVMVRYQPSTPVTQRPQAAPEPVMRYQPSTPVTQRPEAAPEPVMRYQPSTPVTQRPQAAPEPVMRYQPSPGTHRSPARHSSGATVTPKTQPTTAGSRRRILSELEQV